MERYQIGAVLQSQGAFGGDAYEDPVPFDKVFEVVDGVPQVNVALLITVSCIDLEGEPK